MEEDTTSNDIEPMNTTTLEQDQPRTTSSRRPVIPQINISRGAAHHRLADQRVYLAKEVIEDYREMDPNLGYNTIGVILSVLRRHLAAMPAVERQDTFSVGLCRRQDDRGVEVVLSVSRSRRQGQECLVLNRLGDREIQ